MKKILLSLIVIVSFGAYTFFVRSVDISAQLSTSRQTVVDLGSEDTNTTTSTSSDTSSQTSTDKITRNINCVYIPDDRDHEEEYSDDEGSEKYGHYKCTTIIVHSPTPVVVPPATVVKTVPVTTPTTPSKTPVVVTTPPPVISPKSNSKYKNGTYIGDIVDAYYGNVQVSAVFLNDKLTQISFLDYPQDRRTSLQKSNYAMPILKQEAISSQSANVNTVSGVTYTSEAFMQSLSSAMLQAKI